ncbi:hypothetical protein PWG71_19865 [Nocardiopsis sp. N85]|uniref:hypothetical protein n=1 Tax=Nocardiopsis sp. N85 TaxID=3029400 RepID=UPI00237F0872|nr:hypothetical protein [Nocardiopsis sp. N85]MDE3723653.1 hypothetical protein [Nocardiopsis sp. N85]
MSTGTDVLTATDWKRTFHAYGLGTDVPGHLALLLSDDPRDHASALDHLYSAVIHQGSVYSATVPAARFVAGVLDRPGLDTAAPDTDATDGGSSPSLRVRLLAFLRDAVEGTIGYLETPVPPLLDTTERDRVYTAMGSDDEDEAIDIWEDESIDSLMYHEVGVAMREAAPELYTAVRPHLTHPDAATRRRAVEAAAAIARLGGLDLDLSGAADMAETRDEGAVIVLALGESDGDTTEFLAHTDPAIRACAALAPGQRENPAALTELLSALRDPEEADTWFEDRPSFFDRYGTVRSTLLREAALRGTPDDAERMLPVFRGLTPCTSASTADADLGPMLEAAFPDGLPENLTGAQREYLRALADGVLPWKGAQVTAFAALLRRLGLPADREELRVLVGEWE